MKRYSQQGSAHAVVVIALVLALITALGWIFYQNFIQEEPVKKETNLIVVGKNKETKSSSGIYTSTDVGTYVKSFNYPTDWHIVSGDDKCQKFEFCASPPILLLADKNDNLRLRLYGSQSSSDITIDEEALRVAGENGKVATGLKMLDDIEARKVEHTDGRTDIVFESRGGYGGIWFEKSVDNSDIETVLSSWKWF